MILAVETNFILELVLGQREAAACKRLLERSGNSLVTVLPAFALAEAAMVVERRRGERRAFINSALQPQLSEANRSTILARYAPKLDEIKVELLLAEKDEDSRLKFFRVIESARIHVIPLTAEVLDRSAEYEIAGNIERFPDAVVFASVISELEKRRDTPKYFLSRDQRFRNDWCLAELRRVDCKLLSSFTDALAIAEKHL